MRLRALTVLALFFLGVAGCGGGGEAGTPIEEAEQVRDAEQAEPQPPADLPEYDVTAEQEVEQAGQGVKNYSVSTDATSEEDLRDLTLFFRSESPDADAVVVSFYPNEPTAEPSGGGYAFASEEAARAVMGPGYADGDIARIMDDGGLLIIAATEFIDEAIEEQCRSWDYETLGDPPPEWECERFQ